MDNETSRLTRCNFRVDESASAQLASHRLREAAFCPRCLRSVPPESKLSDFEIVFTARGSRRHLAQPLGELDT